MTTRNITSIGGAARRALGLVLLVGAAVSCSGCGESVGDQTEARQKELTYNFDNLAEEVAGRLREARRRGTENAPAAIPTPGLVSGDAGRGAGPGGNPFSIDAISQDVAEKLHRMQYAHTDDEVLKRLGEMLRDQKLPGDLVDPFLTKLKTVELPLAPKT